MKQYNSHLHNGDTGVLYINFGSDIMKSIEKKTESEEKTLEELLINQDITPILDTCRFIDLYHSKQTTHLKPTSVTFHGIVTNHVYDEIKKQKADMHSRLDKEQTIKYYGKPISRGIKKVTGNMMADIDRSIQEKTLKVVNISQKFVDSTIRDLVTHYHEINKEQGIKKSTRIAPADASIIFFGDNLRNQLEITGSDQRVAILSSDFKDVIYGMNYLNSIRGEGK